MIEVAAAIIENAQGEVLIARRRELQEEMNIEIEPYAYFATNEHDYGTVQILLIASSMGRFS